MRRNSSSFIEALVEPLEGERKDDHSSAYRLIRLVSTVIAVSLGSSLQFGFATGSLNNLEPVVPVALGNYGFPVTVAQWALINSFFSVGGLIGSYGCVMPLAVLGRKKTLLLANAFVFLSSALMFFGTRWWVLLIGRVSIGIVAGVAQMTAASYMTEISPVGVRGAVGVCSQAGIVTGIALANFLTAPTFNTIGTLDKWRYVFLVPSGFSIFQLLILPWCPESPSFVVRNKGPDELREALYKLHEKQSASVHLDALRAQMSVGGAGAGDMTVWELLIAPELRKQVIVGIVIKMGVQFSGIDAIFYYSTLMFRNAGVSDPQLATTLLSFVNLFMTFAAMALMDRLGRRVLILTTWVGMCTGFATIFAAVSLSQYGYFPVLMQNLQVCAMVLIIMAFAVGVGNVEGFLISEMMPIYAKDTLLSIGQTLNWLSNLTVSTFFPIVFEALGHWSYLIFVALTFGFGVFTYFKVPETKGRTLEQINMEFDFY